MELSESSWKKIKNLRQAYLKAKGDLPDYWQDEELLALYDLTLAQRIGWKWRSVAEAIEEKIPSGLQQAPLWIDWGCGTGIASRTLLAHSSLRCDEILYFDRSSRAMRFAEKKLREEHPTQAIAKAKSLSEVKSPFVLLVSHVLSEMPAEARRSLVELCRRASLVVWVEAGRTLESRALSQLREEIRQDKIILAPCLHQAPCGILASSEDWCHFSASIPQEVFRSAFWKRCSQELGFDLRSLPVSYLVSVDPQYLSTPPDEGDAIRVLAGSRSYKAFCRWTGCTSQGILKGEFLKRHSRSLYVALSEPDLMTIVTREAVNPAPVDSQ